MHEVIECCVAASLAHIWFLTIPPHLQLISSTTTTPKCTLRSVLFHSAYPAFPKRLFSIADLFAVRYLWVVCTRSLNVAWRLLWRLTTESKIIVKPFTPCAVRTIIFQRENWNYLKVCFTQCFSKQSVFYCRFVTLQAVVSPGRTLRYEGHPSASLIEPLSSAMDE